MHTNFYFIFSQTRLTHSALQRLLIHFTFLKGKELFHYTAGVLRVLKTFCMCSMHTLEQVFICYTVLLPHSYALITPQTLFPHSPYMQCRCETAQSWLVLCRFRQSAAFPSETAAYGVVPRVAVTDDSCVWKSSAGYLLFPLLCMGSLR
jgi:hypothetical protein